MKTKTNIKKRKAKAKKVVSKSTTFAEILEKHPESAIILFESGLHCVGCGMAANETIEQGALAHGMNKKEIDELIEKINVGEKAK